MFYAKVKNNNLISSPYTMQDLMEENPNTNFDDRFTIVEWYAETDEAKSGGNSIVQVNVLPEPTFDPESQQLKMENIPRQVNSEWVVGWEILNQPQRILP